MKICTECDFCSESVVETPMGPQMGLVCSNGECRDPVQGEPLPCNFARRELAFCSVQGKYWKQKENIEDAQIIEIVKS